MTRTTIMQDDGGLPQLRVSAGDPHRGLPGRSTRVDAGAHDAPEHLRNFVCVAEIAKAAGQSGLVFS